MALTPTTQIDLGFKAPGFDLKNVLTEEFNSFNDLKGENGTLIMFICNHCPYVVHVIEQLVTLAKDYQVKGIRFIAISSNDVVNYPADSPDNMKLFAKEYNFSFPYLYDETQEVAKAYDAACTPDLALFDKDALCVYRGRLDEARPGSDATNDGRDMRDALDKLLAGEPQNSIQPPSMGCNIKWK